MFDEQPTSESREHVLRVAEALFSERGYDSVTLKDIATVLKVRQPALYYHAPGGKEELFEAVMTRSFQRHRQGLRRAIAEAEPRIQAQLTAIAFWLLSQPPLNLSRFARSDLPAISDERRQRLYTLGQEALLEPIQDVLTEAYRRGEIRLVDPQVVVSVLLSVIDTIHDMALYKPTPKEVLARDILEIFLDGLRRG